MTNVSKLTCIALFLAANAVILRAQTTFATLVNFDGANGFAPYYESLVQGLNGNLYGTTALGGVQNGGTVFEITPAGTLITVHSFCDQPPCIYQPSAGLVLASNGNFYGTTVYGGDHDNGSVFEISPAGTVTTLHSFNIEDGTNPSSPLVEASDGNFYGTTVGGGSGPECGISRCGTIFKITRTGTLTTLYNFHLTDGAFPRAGLIQATDGNLYGTTTGGEGTPTAGSIFKITPQGTFTTLHTFCGQSCGDGALPYAGLTQASGGLLYGTTAGGGTNDAGTVFSITPAGTLSTLYSFCSQRGCQDGEGPIAGLAQGTDGNFYGTTDGLGNTVLATIFSITPTGELRTLFRFSVGLNDPYGTLTQATNGTFYGTTQQGGSYSGGILYSLAEELGPFVQTLPTSRKVGASVLILGSSLSGTTAVSFNGTPSTFSIVSDTEIKTTVPVGATTGFVSVTTASTTLTSNKMFRVIP
jgi:uncharacterized repeat protein (TIGR03803 family)